MTTLLTPAFTQTRSLRYGYRALLVVLALAVVVFGLITWQRLSFPYQLDYGEGPLLDRALSIHNGRSLKDIYVVPRDYPYHIVNYPPLYFILIAPFIDPENLTYTAGRILSLVSLLVVIVNVFLIVKRLTGNRHAALISALLLPANPIIVFWTPYFRVDFLALAFCMTGLTVLLYWYQTTPGLLLSVALIVAGLFTRQTYIFCAPLAGFVFLLPRSWRRAVAFLGLIGVLGLILLGLINSMTESGFWFHVGEVYLSGGTPVSWEELLRDKWGDSLELAGPLFLILMLIFFWRYANTWFVTTYAVFSFVSIAAMVKAGSNFNYVIELVIAFSLITGILVDRALRGSFRRWQQNLFFALLTLQVFHACTISWGAFWVGAEDRAQRTREWEYLAQEMVKSDGKVLTDIEMGLLPQRGYPILFEPFDFAQMSRQGKWDQTPVLRDVQNQAFGLIVIQAAPDYIIRERWTDEMLEAFNTQYVLSDAFSWCRIYRPRTASTAQ